MRMGESEAQPSYHDVSGILSCLVFAILYGYAHWSTRGIEEDANRLAAIAATGVISGIVGIVIATVSRRVPVFSMIGTLFNGLPLLIVTHLGWLASH